MSAATLTRPRARRLREKLLSWYDANRRDLPWRRSRDPYAIWISETMLQQTRVDTVIPYYERFLERFPTVQALADADEESVYELWAGLGYYSRARNLHAASRRVVDEFGAQLPSDSASLQTLPGIGRYTAGALASIAFDRPAPVVDGNVARVLSRVLGIREDIGLPGVAERIWGEAEMLANGPRPGDLNQALMELGALVCTPRSPGCAPCALRRVCDARRRGDAEQLPIKAPKAKPQRVQASVVWLTRGGRALLVRRESGGLLGGLWELPGGDLEPGEKPADAVRRALQAKLGLEVTGLRLAGRVKHLFTHRDLTLHVLRGEALPGRVRRDGIAEHRWLAAERVGDLASATVTRKALAVLGAPSLRAASA